MDGRCACSARGLSPHHLHITHTRPHAHMHTHAHARTRSWGEYTQTISVLSDTAEATLECAFGTLTITSLEVRSLVAPSTTDAIGWAIRATTATASVGGTPVPGTWDAATATFTFAAALTLAVGQTLTVSVEPSSGAVCVDMTMEDRCAKQAAAFGRSRSNNNCSLRQRKCAGSDDDDVVQGERVLEAVAVEPQRASSSSSLSPARCVVLTLLTLLSAVALFVGGILFASTFPEQVAYHLPGSGGGHGTSGAGGGAGSTSHSPH
jgi:hypothetical protein